MTRLDEDLLVAVSDAIRDRLGLSFRPERWRQLEAGLQMAAPSLGFGDAGECARWVASRPVDESQLKLLAQCLTVGETYFCRDTGVFHVLEHDILPPLVAARRDGERQLRIWSAACCTGEEAYTIAMILRRVIPDLERWNLTLLATDVNSHFLAKAAAGTYGEWSFRRTPQWMRRRHFRLREDGRWEIDADLRAAVTFGYLNLADATYPSVLSNTNAMDIIFCRNVLMYFDAPLVETVAQRLQASLVDGGWLAVGRSEALPVADGGLNPRSLDGETWYRKESARKRRVANTAAASSSAPATLAQPGAIPSFPVEAERLFALGDYADVCIVLRAFLDGGSTGRLERRRAMRMLAHACANLGRLAEAQRWCEDAIGEDRLDARLHYLLASILLERGRANEAEQSLRRALVVDESFVLAHFTLGNLARRRAGRRTARDHYERTLALLRRYRPDDLLPESDGMTARNLSEIATLALAQC